MSDTADSIGGLYKGLRALAEYGFPKKCTTCKRTFADLKEFLMETKNVMNSSGLKQGDDDGKAVVELFRNCVCGSTLVTVYSDRRDMSEMSVKRREEFGQLLNRLKAAGLEVDIARQELLKVMNGQESEILKNMGIKMIDFL